MDPKTSAIIVIALATIAFFVFVFFSYKTWTITHLIMTVLVYFSSIAFVIYAGVTLKTQSEWRHIYNERKKELARAQMELILLEIGFAKNEKGEWISIGEAESEAVKNRKSKRQLETEIEVTLKDRGRAWRNCAPSAINAAGLTLTTYVPDATVDPTAEGFVAPKNNLPVGSVVYCFREEDFTDPDDAANVMRIPTAYMGEFNVTVATDTTVTLVSAGPTTTAFAREWTVPGTWAIYSTMPADDHDLFRGMDLAKLKLFIRQPAGLAVEKYNADLDEYIRSGTTAKADDPPEQVWLKIKFEKPHKIDVDSTEKVVFTDKYFDATGGTIPLLLRRNAATDIAVGDELIVEKTEAQKLIDQGIAKETEKIFMRRLRDYAFLFRQIQLRRLRIYDGDDTIKQDLIPIVASAQKIDEERVYREAEKAKLAADHARFAAEVTAINKHFQAVNARHSANLAELRRLYNENNQYAAELARLQGQMAGQIEQRIRGSAPAPMTPPAAPSTPPASTPPAGPPAAPATPPAATPATPPAAPAAPAAPRPTAA